MEKSKPKVIVILGPTASGKTKLAVKLANRFDGEIVSADSRQVYRGMTIGTGKDLADYKIGNKQIPYHLIDVVSPKTEFNVAKWLKLTNKAIADILKRGKVPFVVGGTGLYISALVEEYNLAETKPDLKLRKRLEKQSLEKLLARLKKLDKMTYKKIDKKNKRRVVRALEVCLKNSDEGENIYSRLRGKTSKPNFDFLILGVGRPRKETIKLIDKRTEKQLKQGMIKEVKKLHKNGVSWKRLDDFGLQYQWAGKYLRGEIEKDEMTRKLKIAVRQFAKRQMTWFRGMKNIRWVKNYKEARMLIAGWIKD